MLNFAQNKLEVGSKNKLKRFSENETFTNVFQPTREEVVGNEFPLRGKWNREFFKNDNPIVLELGCGKGEYSVGLAERFPNKNFIGIDIKGARFWRGAKTAVETGMNNVAFVRTQIELINHIFAENEVSEIWITFPDPQIKYKRTKHRMTNAEFLERYKKILKPSGLIHLKTDSEPFFDYSLEQFRAHQLPILAETKDLYTSEWNEDHFGIKTRFEKIWYDKGRGKHTTRTVSLIELPFGGLLADSPGFSQPSLDRVDSAALGELFPEFERARHLAGGCRCGHV